MDLNERIARLLEPDPVFDSEYGFSVGGAWLCHEGVHDGDFFDDSVTFDGEIKPLPFKESLDASMRVIEKRWPGAEVEIKTPKPHYEFFLASLCHMPTEDRPSLLAQEVSKESASEALALALCAALEAEPTP